MHVPVGSPDGQSVAICNGFRAQAGTGDSLAKLRTSFLVLCEGSRPARITRGQARVGFCCLVRALVLQRARLCCMQVGRASYVMAASPTASKVPNSISEFVLLAGGEGR